MKNSINIERTYIFHLVVSADVPQVISQQNAHDIYGQSVSGQNIRIIRCVVHLRNAGKKILFLLSLLFIRSFSL